MPGGEGKHLLTEEIIGMTKARDELPQRVRRLEQGDLKRVVIVRNSSPVAVILSAEEYERMTALESDREFYEDAVAILRALEADDGTRYTLDEIKKEFGVD